LTIFLKIIYESYKKYDKAKELYLRVLEIAPENETERSGRHNLLEHEK
jgi:tetratricopeptide (TPR) repeat protein